MNEQDKLPFLGCLLGVVLLLPLPSTVSGGEGHGASSQSPSVSDAEDSGVSSRGTGDIILLKPPALPAQVLANQPGPAPANVSLTAVTPTNIMIQWSPSPGAVRYVISRNGAPDIPIETNAGFLQGNRFVYTDVGRKPAMLHTYSVTAQFPVPTRPSRSVPVQVLTPPALPPQNFTATVSSPNSIALNWKSRSEAASYRIVRNGGNLPATVFNVSAQNYVDQNLPPGEYTYLIYSVMRLANGQEFTGEFSNPVTVKTRPFNMVSFGDSVMWGQGLLAEHKFANKVKDWIASQLKKPVNLDMKAHSGAVTYPESSPGLTSHVYDGEVPADWPTISAQIAAAGLGPPTSQIPANDVDLVLVDGCANDLGIVTVLNMFLDDGDLQTNTRTYCGEAMTNILSQVVQKFPNAKIITTGYFPFVSSESAFDKLWAVMGVVGIVAPPDPIVGGAIFTAIFQARASARSDVFFQESNSSLQGAVDAVNGMPFEKRTKFNQIRFARLNPAPNNSYAGSDTWQWLVPAPPFAQDEVYDHRRSVCANLLGDTQYPGTSLGCLQASMGHPNVNGAQAYTTAVTSVATEFLPEWRTIHVASAPAPDDPLVIKVQPVASEPGGGTMVVTASDGSTGPALQGTVRVNSLPAGALGAQVRYLFQQNNPTDVLVSVDVPGRRSHSFTVPVRKQALAVNVTNSGDPRSAVVTATDSVTGQVLSGNVTIHTSSNQISGPTGQSLNYPSCGQANQSQRFTKVTINVGPVPCTGMVHVPYYPDASFQDVSGTINLAIQTRANILTKPPGP